MAAERYTVLFDEPQYCNLEDARSADDGERSIPAQGESHEKNEYLKAREPTGRKTSPTMCEIMVNYMGWSSPEGEEDPENWETQYSWSTATSVVPIDEDVDGNPIVNVNKEAFDPPPTREHHDTVVTIVHHINESRWDPSDKITYENTLNSEDTVLDGKTVPAGTARITSYDAEHVIEGEYSYVKLTIVVAIREDGWKLRILNQGYKDAAGDEFKDAKGTPRAAPTLLDVVGDETTTAWWLEFDVYEEKDWNTLDAFNAPS